MMFRSDSVYTSSRPEEEASMTRFVTISAWCVVVVALVGGCADRSSKDSASADEPSASAASSAAQSAGTAAPATTSTSATASHCASATPEILHPAAQLRYGHVIVQPFTLDTIRCSGDWARARIPATSSYPQDSMMLFHHIGDGWSAVQFGSGFNCTPEGVPASTAAELGC